jgi:hypothetical protein
VNANRNVISKCKINFSLPGLYIQNKSEASHKKRKAVDNDSERIIPDHPKMVHHDENKYITQIKIHFIHKELMNKINDADRKKIAIEYIIRCNIIMESGLPLTNLKNSGTVNVRE